MIYILESAQKAFKDIQNGTMILANKVCDMCYKQQKISTLMWATLIVSALTSYKDILKYMCSTDLNIETLLCLFWLQHCRTFTHYDLTFSLWHKIALCDFWQFNCCFTSDGPAMLRFEHVFFKIYCHYCNFRSIVDETASHRDFASQNVDKIAACERTFKKQSQPSWFFLNEESNVGSYPQN